VTKLQRFVIAALALMACGLSMLVGSSALQLYDRFASQPMGAALPTSPYTPLTFAATWTPASQIQGTEAGSASQTLSARTPLCGGPTTMSLLLIGSDTRGTGYTWGLADVIRVARVDFVTPSLRILDFPRDVWVEIPEIADDLDGQDHEKLNQAYLYGNPGDGFGYWDDPSAGPGLLARTLDLNFGVRADHYLAVNMRTFVRMVDAVDGIDVTLEHPVSGSNNPHLQGGTHHLDGTEALAVARDRGEGVFSRGDNQNLVLCALKRKLADPKVLTRVPELVQSFQGSVQTDLDLKTIKQLACLARQLRIDEIAFYSFPQELFTGNRVYDPVFEKSVFIWDYDPLVIRNYTAQFQEGIWPDQDGGGSATRSTSYCQ
jgi:LCP family protein required for cell wall assembly